MISLCCKSMFLRDEVFCNQGSVQISLEIKSVERCFHVCMRARFNRVLDFLLSQVSHKS